MKITNLSRSLAISSSTVLNDVVTVVTASNHLLVTGDTVTFWQAVGKEFTVTVTDATTFTVPANISINIGSTIMPAGVCYATALRSGGQISNSYPMASSSDSSFTFQAIGLTTAGSGSAVVTVEASNNGTNWLTVGSVTLTLGTTVVSDKILITSPWGYFRINATTLTGTNAKVNVLLCRH